MPHKHRLGVLIITPVLLTAGVVTALWAQASPTAAGFKSLTLTLSVPARSFLLLEPVPLTITLVNATAEPVVADAALRFADRAIGILIQPEGSPPYRAEPLSTIAIYTRPSPRPLPPGYRQVSTEPLILNLQKLMPVPGKYGIQAVLRNLDEEIRSNVVSIDVTQPAGLDQLAYQFLVDSGQADDFLDGSDVVSKPELYGEYETFVRTYPGTAYADYANLFLGRFHETRRQIDQARRFFSNVTARREYATQKAAEALKRLPAP